MKNSFSRSTHRREIAPEIIVVNARVHTMDVRFPIAEAVALYGAHILAVGTTAEIQRMVGARTRVINAGGRVVLPGFNDSHVHFMRGGFQLSNVDLRNSDSPQEFAERIREFATKTRRGQWITGGDWDHERWPGAPLPTKELIDPFTSNIPVFVNRLDGHMSLANSLALKLANVESKTEDVPGGLIVRNTRTGEPTGILKDAAQGFVWEIVPDHGPEEKLAAARAATHHAARMGVTSVQDMSAGSDVGTYQTLLDGEELLTRVYAVWRLSDWQSLARLGGRVRFGRDMLRIGGLKGFADGSLGSTTALFFKPYNDAPHTCGLAADEMYPEGSMLRRVMEADRHGLQVMIHAIGDRANDKVLSIYERVTRENGERDRRFRVEHAQHLRARDIARFSEARIIASMQPYHAIDDGRWAERRIGKRRARMAFAFRSLLDSGATLAFGTDWNIAPLNPLLGICAAVTRSTLDGRHPDGWIPEQKITVEEAVRAYTVGSARAEFTDDVKGTIAPGKLADIVILSDDIFRIDPANIEKTRVVTTIVGSRIVHQE